MNSGKTGRTLLATLLTALVLVTGTSSVTSANPIDNQTINASLCPGDDRYDRPVFIQGTFSIQVDGSSQVMKHSFNGCYRFNADGYARMPGGPTWIFDISLAFARGYKHATDAQNGVSGWYRMHFVGDGKHDNYYYVNSSGEIWDDETWKNVGPWSDAYNAGYRNGYLAEERKQHERRVLRECLSRVKSVDLKPRAFGPEQTFEIAHPVTGGLPVQYVTVGFRAVTDDVREPRVEGNFPWCVQVEVIKEKAVPGWKLAVVFGDYRDIWGYDANGPYVRREWKWTPAKGVWHRGNKVHNEDLWPVVTG